MGNEREKPYIRSVYYETDPDFVLRHAGEETLKGLARLGVGRAYISRLPEEPDAPLPPEVVKLDLKKIDEISTK